jgi:prevent-host-death family protein
MRAVNIADLKNNLSRYLNEVRSGAEVVVKDRNKPIARIVPLGAAEHGQAELMELVAEGSARLPKTDDPLPESFWTGPLPKAGVDLIGLLREDRDAR